MAALTLLLATILAGNRLGWRRWSRGFWAPFAVVAVALVFGVKFG